MSPAFIQINMIYALVIWHDAAMQGIRCMKPTNMAVSEEMVDVLRQRMFNTVIANRIVYIHGSNDVIQWFH